MTYITHSESAVANVKAKDPWPTPIVIVTLSITLKLVLLRMMRSMRQVRCPWHVTEDCGNIIPAPVLLDL
ncbi:hypothetical protein SK128_000168 [Halocaridina rubra]|uniref:Uncharacterized protein n=1 Tax=Halocaridina rubra TaxID=373956 RepID=A0AAN9A2T0_HALRR